MTKDKWRDEIRHRLSAMDVRLRARESSKIAGQLQNLVSSRHWKTVLIYAPLKDEPDILSLTTNSKVRWVFPRMEAKNQLGLYAVGNPSRLIQGKWGIREPNPSQCTRIEPSDLDAIVVPGMAMDPKTGARLGRGGGFYDRLLSNGKIRAEIIGVCFPCQKVSGLPEESHDVRLHTIIST